VPTYVWRNGLLVERGEAITAPSKASALPAPAVHNFASYASPIDDRSITSPRERERDLARSGSYDPRDTAKKMKEARDGRRKRSNTATE